MTTITASVSASWGRGRLTDRNGHRRAAAPVPRPVTPGTGRLTDRNGHRRAAAPVPRPVTPGTGRLTDRNGHRPRHPAYAGPPR